MNAYSLVKTKPENLVGDRSFLENHTFSAGLGFPPSYKEWVTTLGWGRVCGLFLIYIPLQKDYPDSWQKRSAAIKSDMDHFYRSQDDPMFLEPDGTVELMRTCIPFAMSENGEYLVWDRLHPHANQELPIYVIASRMGGVRLGASDLYAFIDYCTDDQKVKQVLGTGYSKLPRTFEPMQLH